MAAGSAEPAAARRAMTPVGSRVTLEVDGQKQGMASVAVPGARVELGSFLHGADAERRCRALPRPMTFADRLRIMRPWPGARRNIGNSRTINGRIRRAMIEAGRPPRPLHEAQENGS